MKKALVLDMDDTLLNSDHQISPRTLQALLTFQENGGTLVLASGRPTPGMLRAAEELKLAEYDSHLISFNGGVITALKNNEIIYESRLLPEDQVEIIAFLQENEIPLLTYWDDEIIFSHHTELTEIESELNQMPYRVTQSFFKEHTEPLVKIMGVTDAEIIAPIEAKLAGSFGKNTTAVTSKPIFLEFFNADTSKGHALTTLFEQLDIPLADVVAVGDGNNDIAMLEVAGVSLAVENASDDLKAVADQVIGHHNNDPIVDVLETYFAHYMS